MNSNLIAAITFVAGAGIGSVVTWKLLKNKYEQRAQEEINSVKEVFARRFEKEKDKREYAEVVNELKYTLDIDENEEKGDTMTDDVYVISPDEVGDFEDYDVVTLTYYADDVLTDSDDNPIDKEDLDDYVGSDFAEHFGDYEDDAVHIRNDRLEIDYEILRDLRNYSDVVNK